MFRPCHFCALLLAGTLACMGGASRAFSAPDTYTDEDLRPKPQTQPQAQPPAPGLRQGAPQTRPGVTPASPRPTPQTQPGAQPPTQKMATGAQPPAPPLPADPASAQKPPPPPDDQAWTRDWKRQKETREYWQQRVDEAKRGVERLEQKVLYLERKRASIQNPFIPRVTLNDEDRAAEEGMDGTARLARVEAQLASAKSELVDARSAVQKAEQEMVSASTH